MLEGHNSHPFPVPVYCSTTAHLHPANRHGMIVAMWKWIQDNWRAIAFLATFLVLFGTAVLYLGVIAILQSIGG